MGTYVSGVDREFIEKVRARNEKKKLNEEKIAKAVDALTTEQGINNLLEQMKKMGIELNEDEKENLRKSLKDKEVIRDNPNLQQDQSKQEVQKLDEEKKAQENQVQEQDDEER